LAASAPTGLGQSAAVVTRPANAQPAHDSRTRCRGFADFSPVFLQSASIDASDVMGRRFKKAGGNWRSTTRVRRAAPNVRLITPISPWY